MREEKCSRRCHKKHDPKVLECFNLYEDTILQGKIPNDYNRFEKWFFYSSGSNLSRSPAKHTGASMRPQRSGLAWWPTFGKRCVSWQGNWWSLLWTHSEVESRLHMSNPDLLSQDVDFAMSEISCTFPRQAIIECSYNYNIDVITFMSRLPQEKNAMYTIAWTFDLWASTCSSVPFSCMCKYLYCHRS